MFGLMISNAIIAFSGSLMAQYNGFCRRRNGSDNDSNRTCFYNNWRYFLRNSNKLGVTTRAIIGAIAYRLIAGLALYKGLDPQSLKMVTALIVILFIAYNNATATYGLKFIQSRRNKNA